ncbi:MAG: ATP-dependent helicase RecG, partial [Abditibacteriota bacterium]|nr:ATP-dependent helicase RecG [Abditibacteriota bacterium]
MIEALLQKVNQPLAIEHQLACSNTAVVGGTDAHVLAQVRRALDGIALGELPTDSEFTWQRLNILWESYAEAETGGRERVLDETQRLLARLRQEVRAHKSSIQNGASKALPLPFEPATFEPAPHEAVTETSEEPMEPMEPMEPAYVAPPEPQFPPSELDSELTYLKGIGPKRAALLAKLGLHTVRDLLYYFPARYEDRRLAKTIEELVPGERDSVLVTVLYPPQSQKMGGRMGGRSLTRVRVGDETGRLDLQWWNQAFREKQFQPGMQLFVYGKISEFNGFLQIDSPDFEIMSDPNSEAQAESAALQVGRIVPVYPATEGLLQTALRRALFLALDKYADLIEEPIPPEVLSRHNLRPVDWSMRQIHFPDSWENK